MSLENYTTSGNILPIGLLVCAHCKDKCLKGVDFANSQVVSGDSGKEEKKTAVNPATSSTNEMQQQEKGGGPSKVKEELRVQPVQRQRAQPSGKKGSS